MTNQPLQDQTRRESPVMKKERKKEIPIHIINKKTIAYLLSKLNQMVRISRANDND